MIHGIGIDLIEIDRIKKLLRNKRQVSKRILTQEEEQQFHSFKSEKRKLEFLSGRFNQRSFQ